MLKGLSRASIQLWEGKRHHTPRGVTRAPAFVGTEAPRDLPGALAVSLVHGSHCEFT